MKININKKNIIQTFIVITALVCIFGYVFVNNTKILKAEDVTSTEVTIYCHKYAAYTDEYEIVSTTHEGGEWTFNYKVKCICPTCGHEVWEEDRERSYSDTDYPTEEKAIAELESDLENDVRSESNTECNNAIGPMNFYIAAFQKNLYGFSENTYFISIKLNTNGVFEADEDNSLKNILEDDLHIGITASSENGSWDDNYWWSSDVDANDPDNTMEYIAYLDYNDVYTFTLVNTDTGEELGSLVYTVNSILSPHDEALANHCTLTVDANLPDGFTTSDIKDDYGNSMDNPFGNFLVKKSENILSSGSDGISITYTTEIDEYGNISEESLGYYDGTSNNYEFLYNNSDKEYYFYGFNTNPDGTGENITELNITNDTTIYAIWKPYLYNLSYYEYNPYGVSYYDPYNVYYIDNSNLYSDYIIKYNGNNFNPTEYWQDYDGISGSDFAKVGLDDDLNLPELTLAGYTFTGWDIVDPEYYYTRSYTDRFFKFIGKPNKLRNNWTYSEQTDSNYVSSTSQSITLIPHFEKTHEGNIKINLYVNSEKNNYTIFDDIILDYNTLSDTADLPITVETNGQTSTSLTIAIDNDNCNIDGDIPYDSNYSLFIEDHNGDHLVNLNLIKKVNNNDNVFGNDSLIQIKDNNNNSLAGYISRTEIVATPSGDQDMILNLYFDLYEYPQSYNIEYDLNDISDYYDVNIGVCPTSANVGSEVTIPKPTLKGYTFIGWKVNDTTQIINQNDGIYTNLGADEETVTLTAQWQPWTIDVAFVMERKNKENGSITIYQKQSNSDYYQTIPTSYWTNYSDKSYSIHKYDNHSIDINKPLNTIALLDNDYNDIMTNYKCGGYEITGFYIIIDNYTNQDTSLSYAFETRTTSRSNININQTIIELMDSSDLNNFESNTYNCYIVPKWEPSYYISVNTHYLLQDTNGEYTTEITEDDFAIYSSYIFVNNSGQLNANKFISSTVNKLSTGDTLVSQLDDTYEVDRNTHKYYGLQLTDKYFITQSGSNISFNTDLYSKTFQQVYNAGGLSGFYNDKSYIYPVNIPGTTSSTKVYEIKEPYIDTSRSTITYTSGEAQDAVVDIYYLVPLKYANVMIYLISDDLYNSSANYYMYNTNINFTGESIKTSNTFISPLPCSISRQKIFGSFSLLNDNNVSERHWGGSTTIMSNNKIGSNYYYLVNYYGSNLDINMSIDGYDILIYYGNQPTKTSDFVYDANGHIYIENISQPTYKIYIMPTKHRCSPLNLNLDGTNIDINDVIYNGSHINKLVVDDETIWEKTCEICGQAM